jgi:hypothetical protein
MYASLKQSRPGHIFKVCQLLLHRSCLRQQLLYKYPRLLNDSRWGQQRSIHYS